MVQEVLTSLSEREVLERAKQFFLERIPHSGAYLEIDGPSYVTFRGQGGEEIVIAAFRDGDLTKVRGSTLLYEQAVGRLFSTFPQIDASSG